MTSLWLVIFVCVWIGHLAMEKGRMWRDMRREKMGRRRDRDCLHRLVLSCLSPSLFTWWKREWEREQEWCAVFSFSQFVILSSVFHGYILSPRRTRKMCRWRGKKLIVCTPYLIFLLSLSPLLSLSHMDIVTENRGKKGKERKTLYVLEL